MSHRAGFVTLQIGTSSGSTVRMGRPGPLCRWSIQQDRSSDVQKSITMRAHEKHFSKWFLLSEHIFGIFVISPCKFTNIFGAQKNPYPPLLLKKIWDLEMRDLDHNGLCGGQKNNCLGMISKGKSDTSCSKPPKFLRLRREKYNFFERGHCL